MNAAIVAPVVKAAAVDAAKVAAIVARVVTAAVAEVHAPSVQKAEMAEKAAATPTTFLRF